MTMSIEFSWMFRTFSLNVGKNSLNIVVYFKQCYLNKSNTNISKTHYNPSRSYLLWNKLDPPSSQLL